MPWGYMYVFKVGHNLGARPRRRPACGRSLQLLNPPCGVCVVLEKEFVSKFAAWYSGGLTVETRVKSVVTLASILRHCELGNWT